ncbi:MAG TPA: TrkA C-terminal domain-containing protein [Nitrospiria bacterium]|nr:TrkA C-terminal domain-containing protein [Nitrospiria bacterium]
MISNLLKRLKNELYIDLNGAKLILFEIAEKTSAKVGSIKRSIQAAELDSKIDKEYEALGLKICNLLNEGKDPLEGTGVLDIVNRLRSLKQSLLRFEEEMAYFSDGMLISKVLELKDGLKNGSAALETITISKDSPLVQVKVSDLKLPPGLLIILIKRSGQVLIPNGSTELIGGDSLMMMGFKSRMDETTNLFNKV